ncbi:anti-sigma factor [Nocardia spumae]|uniref:anti-sigma factor n=1 Tax=Nocardia spumae TaxID=2887190 RepID=UPI001D135830|nr:anti-sigma factor [Nocardia spumae]
MSGSESSELDLLGLAEQYALDALTTVQRGMVEDRRERSDRFAAAEFDAAVAAVHEVLAQLSVVTACSPPHGMENRILHALDNSACTGRSVTAGHRAWWPPPRRDLVLVTATAVLALGGLVAVTAQHFAGRDSPPAITAMAIDAQPDLVVRTVPAADGGRVEVHSSAGLSELAVSVAGLLPPGPDRSYQIWLSSADGTTDSLAVFDSPPASTVVAGFRSADTIAVTVEPAGGSPRPTTKPIASIDLS